jgi:hypothetical protein
MIPTSFASGDVLPKRDRERPSLWRPLTTVRYLQLLSLENREAADTSASPILRAVDEASGPMNKDFDGSDQCHAAETLSLTISR